MSGWSVDVLGCADEQDSRDIRCADVSELARVVGVATSLSKARVVHIRAILDGETLMSSPAVDDEPIGDYTVMSLRTDRLVALRRAWVAGDGGYDGGRTYAAIVAAVRDLFDGHDGDLHALPDWTRP